MQPDVSLQLPFPNRELLSCTTSRAFPYTLGNEIHVFLEKWLTVKRKLAWWLLAGVLKMSLISYMSLHKAVRTDVS